MQYKGPVFFDYDGTLADEKAGIYYPTETTKTALKKLKQNGYMTVLATGRAKCYVPDTGIDFDGYVTSNGACAEVCGSVIFDDCFSLDGVYELIEKFEEMNLYYSLENRDLCYARDKDNGNFTAMLDNFNIPKNIFVNLDKSNIPKTSKMLVVYETHEEFEYLSDYFKGKFAFYEHRKFLSADVTKQDIVKAVGAKAICEKYNIPRENIYAFGDGSNDYDIMQYAGHGIAMGFHHKILEKAAEIITDTVENEGINKALLRYGLID